MSLLVAQEMQEAMTRSSWIRKMFEEGARLKAEFGAHNVYDFSLGAPILPPPLELHEQLQALVALPVPGMHGYLPNAGLPEAREAIGQHLAQQTGLAFSADRVLMTCGAAGGLNVVFKALLNPGDEVMTLAPYFVEYGFYAANHGGRLVTVPSDEAFQPDPAAIEAAITPHTRVLLLNSPHNPTGVVYGEAVLRQVAEVLKSASEKHGRPIYLVSDEPYRALVFDGVDVPWLPKLYPHTIVVTSHSKDLGLPGERIGFAAVSPLAADGELLMNAMILANRILGFVNAPALIQRVLPALVGKTVDASYYQRLRDLLVEPLQQMGYEVVSPQGAFYLFPKAPGGDDIAFAQKAQEKRLLVVPGTGFGRPGHFRISYSVPAKTIAQALPVFAELI